MEFDQEEYRIMRKEQRRPIALLGLVALALAFILAACSTGGKSATTTAPTAASTATSATTGAAAPTPTL